MVCEKNEQFIAERSLQKVSPIHFLRHTWFEAIMADILYPRVVGQPQSVFRSPENHGFVLLNLLDEMVKPDVDVIPGISLLPVPDKYQVSVNACLSKQALPIQLAMECLVLSSTWTSSITVIDGKIPSPVSTYFPRIGIIPEGSLSPATTPV
jgi:hypothetical protein